jgi:uncharacterized protein
VVKTAFSEAARLAIHLQNLKALEKALQADVDLDARDESDGSDSTLMHIAATSSDTPGLIQALVARGADVNLLDASGQTPLYAAVNAKYVQNIRALLDAGADVDVIVPKDNTTALFRAIYIGRPDIALMLLDRSRNVNVEAENDGGTPLLWAAGLDSPELVQRLVEKGADIHAPGVLQSAAFKSRLQNIEFLVSKGADINARNRYGSTCLHVAAGQGRKDDVKWLLDHAADPLLDGEDGTPLDGAVRRGHEKVAELLREEMRRRGSDGRSKFDFNLPKTKA